MSSLPSFCVSTVAANATSESFAISDGWSVNGPRLIHRDAPYTDEPAVGWSATSSSATETISSGPDSRRHAAYRIRAVTSNTPIPIAA